MLGIMNRLVRLYINKWNKEIDQIKHNCPETQENELKLILHSPLVQYIHANVSPFTSYEKFSTTFPVTTYVDIKDKIEALQNNNTLGCEYFAQSAGTSTGIKKLIPTPESFVRKNHLRGSWYILHTLYEHDKDMSVFKAKNLLIGGSIYKRLKTHTIADISGIMLNRIPSFFRPWYTPKIATAVHPDWNYKIEKTAEVASQETGVTLLGGTPTWVLSTLKKILARTEQGNLINLWPNLKAFVHGGVNFEPYRRQFEKLIPSDTFRYIEVYNASEGFFAYQDRKIEKGMLLMCASGIFFEFIKYEDFKANNFKACAIGDVEVNQAYVILISTESGLLRYVQGDVIRFVTCSPYRIVVEGRVSDYINAFGEDLMMSHVTTALDTICEKHNVQIEDYSVAPFYLTMTEKGRHDWYIEFLKEPENLKSFTKDLDDELRQINSNYHQKRSADGVVDTLKIHLLPKNITRMYFEKYSKVSAQSKLPRMRNDRTIANRLEALL